MTSRSLPAAETRDVTSIYSYVGITVLQQNVYWTIYCVELFRKSESKIKSAFENTILRNENVAEEVGESV